MIRQMDENAASLFNECKDSAYELVPYLEETGCGTRYACLK
jgi:hypothetical protein